MSFVADVFKAVASVFGFGSKDAPSAPAYKPPPGPTDAEIQKAAEDKRLAEGAKDGRRATIVGGAKPALSEEDSKKKTLLGG